MDEEIRHISEYVNLFLNISLTCSSLHFICPLMRAQTSIQAGERISAKDLERKDTWTGTHLGISFEINHFGVERGKHSALNEGKGSWTYYIFILERQLENFNDFWLQCEVKTFSDTPNSSYWESFNYYESPLSKVSWHYGVTYWSQGNEKIPNQRYIKVGCDYSHLWDQETGYNETIGTVLSDALTTIEEIVPLLKLKPFKP